jgi:hypothetical protein
MPIRIYKAKEKPAPVLIDPHPIEGPLSPILPLEIRQVRRTVLEKLCNSLIEQYHYLGYCQPGGRAPEVSGLCREKACGLYDL